MIPFKEYIAEAKEPDGVKYLDHRDVWVVYLNGRIMTTKKTEDAANKWLAKQGDAKLAQPAPHPLAKPSKKDEKLAAAVEDAVAEEEEPAKPINFNIPEHNLDYFKAKIEKLNKIAAKLKVEPVTYKIGDFKVKKILSKADAELQDLNNPGFDMEGFPLGQHIKIYNVEVHGEAPKLNGWSFIGKREPMEGAGTILAKSAPGQTLPKKYSDDHDITCEHCNRNRRRNESFVVKKGRKYMEVGRSCLKDFLGHADPTKYASFAEMLYDIQAAFSDMEDSEYEGGAGRWNPLFSTDDAVAAAIHTVKHEGFVSNQNAYGSKMSTSARVNRHLNPGRKPSNMSSKEWFDLNNIPVTPEDEKEAKEAIEWMKNHPKASREEFYTNVSKIASSETMSLKYTGYLAAAVNQHLKEKGTAKQHEGVMKTIKKDEGLGKENEKVTVKGTILSAFRYQNDWGTKNILTVKTDSGHLVKMFTMSGDEGVKKGARVEITGKIGKVEPETYETSPFKGMMVTTMAPRSRVESLFDADTTDKHYHVGDKIKFRGADGKGKVGQIVAKPTFGKFEVKSITQANAATIHVSYEDILGLM